MDFTPFIDYCNKHIKGDEKGEAQIYLDRFFTALGYADGLRGAGADCEYRVKDAKKKSTSFADLVWKPRVLVEMKKRGEDLSIHYQQAFSYWQQLVPNRPRYVMLCNFDEFWIYDFDTDIYEPLQKVPLEKLNENKDAFAFLFPVEKKPIFNYNREDVTAKIALQVSALYKSLAKNPARNPVVPIEDAMRYCLQCILCLFAEDIELLPDNIFTRIIEECVEAGKQHDRKVPESFDLIGGLFEKMNQPGITQAGKYKGVEYFNGGLFEKIVPIELEKREIDLLEVACHKNWRQMNPAIFGSIFEGTMEGDERHELGAHYTHETDIKKIVDPVIIQPWKEKIDAVMDNHTAKTKDITLSYLYELHKELTNYKVLDPACGSGNFLFIAYKELKLLEKEIFKYILTLSTEKGSTEKFVQYKLKNGLVSTKQFYGIDLNPFAVEIARVTLMIAKELSIKDAVANEETLPLDNLDNNIICTDALFTEWPVVDAIIGNPPFQSKNKMQQEFGVEYINKLRKAYPEVPGRADFCVYWFYKAHKQLKENSYAGLVGTNTIRQNYSREGSLDYIVNNGGEIINAYSSFKWSGEAAVYVSIVCWKKGKYESEKSLYIDEKDDDTKRVVLPVINSSLSLNVDVTSAEVLECNKKPKKVFQGQTHGHEGFLLTKAKGIEILKQHPEYSEVLKPFLIGEELVANINAQPERFVIDFTLKNVIEASKFKELYKTIEKKVLPEREEKGKKQEEENKEALKNNLKAKVNKHHINFLKSWWKLGYGREDMLEQKNSLKRYIACARVTQRSIFEFFSAQINPNDKLMAFMLEDDYSFGIIQSNIHWQWFLANCTTLGETPNYNTASIWDTFPWPQTPTETQIKKVAAAAKALHTERTATLKKHNMSLRDLYRLLEQPGKNPIKDLHEALDKAVLEAYGFNVAEDILTQLLALNLSVAEKEKKGDKVQAPGLPDFVKNKESYVSEECVRFEWG
jgi:type I restriction-modification system DNA methylase subunit